MPHPHLDQILALIDSLTPIDPTVRFLGIDDHFGPVDQPKPWWWQDPTTPAPTHTEMFYGLGGVLLLAKERQYPEDRSDIAGFMAKQAHTATVSVFVFNCKPQWSSNNGLGMSLLNHTPLIEQLQFPRTVWRQAIAQEGSCVPLIQRACRQALSAPSLAFLAGVQRLGAYRAVCYLKDRPNAYNINTTARVNASGMVVIQGLSGTASGTNTPLLRGRGTKTRPKPNMADLLSHALTMPGTIEHRNQSIPFIIQPFVEAEIPSLRNLINLSAHGQLRLWAEAKELFSQAGIDISPWL